MDSNAGEKALRPRTANAVRSWATSCPAEIAVAVLGGAWKPSILHQLESHSVLRFGELGRAIGDPSPRVLTRQLRELEDDGLINRVVYPEVPPRVEYSLTALGESASGVLSGLTSWGSDYAATRREFLDL